MCTQVFFMSTCTFSLSLSLSVYLSLSVGNKFALWFLLCDIEREIMRSIQILSDAFLLHNGTKSDLFMRAA